MDTIKRGEMDSIEKCMGGGLIHFKRYLSELLSLWRKTEAISTL